MMMRVPDMRVEDAPRWVRARATDEETSSLKAENIRMKKVMEAIAAFWNEGDAPLSPFALITDTGMGIARDVTDTLRA